MHTPRAFDAYRRRRHLSTLRRCRSWQALTLRSSTSQRTRLDTSFRMFTAIVLGLPTASGYVLAYMYCSSRTRTHVPHRCLAQRMWRPGLIFSSHLLGIN